MMKEVFVLVLCVSVAYCAIMREIAPTSGQEKADGYACKSSSSSLGLMKAGESRNNYKPGLCAEASCSADGTITYTSCGIAVKEGCVLVENSSKPYPSCCVDFKCD